MNGAARAGFAPAVARDHLADLEDGAPVAGHETPAVIAEHAADLLADRLVLPLELVLRQLEIAVAYRVCHRLVSFSLAVPQTFDLGRGSETGNAPVRRTWGWQRASGFPCAGRSDALSIVS